MSHAAALAAPQASYPLEDDVREALEICGGDAMKALRITLIANAFLEAQLDQLTAATAAGFARRKPRSTRKLKRDLA